VSVPPAGSNADTRFFVARYGTSFLARADTDFHAQIRELFVSSTVPRLETIRQYAAGFIQTTDQRLRLEQLDGLLRKVHALVGNAALAGCAPIAHYTSLLEALLLGLRDAPDRINDSARHTVARTIETLGELLTNVACLEEAIPGTLTALVIEPDPATARQASASLEEIRCRTTVTADPVEALGLLATHCYDLVVASIHLPGTTAFEIHAQMQLFPGHAATPLVFLTLWDNFPSHLADPVVMENELVGKPFPPIELSLKALGLLLRSRVRRAGNRPAFPFSVPPSAGGAAPSY
jgi:CheY-like chemotaxis protein